MIIIMFEAFVIGLHIYLTFLMMVGNLIIHKTQLFPFSIALKHSLNFPLIFVKDFIYKILGMFTFTKLLDFSK